MNIITFIFGKKQKGENILEREPKFIKVDLDSKLDFETWIRTVGVSKPEKVVENNKRLADTNPSLFFNLMKNSNSNIVFNVYNAYISK